VISACLDVYRHAAETLGHAADGLGRHHAAGIPHAPLADRMGSLKPVLVKVGIGAGGEVSAPSFLECSPSLLKGFGNPIKPEAAMGYRVETAMPSPSLKTLGNTGSLPNPTDTDVAIEDLPAFLTTVLLAAVGESGRIIDRTGAREAARKSRSRKP
jgi:hypothetical protein